MAIRAAAPVTAGLSQVAQMDRHERNRIVRKLCDQYPAFRTLLTRVAMARAIAFGSGLTLAMAVMLLVQGASATWVCVLVFGGLAGFSYVAIVLTDSRFDLLLAVIGAHRTDELHGLLVTEQVYGPDPVADRTQGDGSPVVSQTVQRRVLERDEGNARGVPRPAS